MKSSYSVLLSLFVAISTISLSAHAEKGNGSGNGDGDQAFALQKLAASNPGLSPSQVLLKAFKESAGRIPAIKYTYDREGAAHQVFTGYLFAGIQNPTGHIDSDDGIEFSLKDGQESGPKSVSNSLTFRNEVPKLGPLLQPQSGTEYFVAGYRNSGAGVDRIDGTTTNNGQSKILHASIGSEVRNAPWIELRSYSQDTVIFIVRPFIFADGTNRCITLGTYGYRSYFPTKSATDICSVGYFWKAK